MIGSTAMVFSAPNTEPSTVGNKLKNEPQPMPLITANAARTPMLEEKGQIASELTAQQINETRKLFRGPSRESAVYPAPTRPTVDAMFQMVKPIIAVLPDWLIERAKMGIK